MIRILKFLFLSSLVVTLTACSHVYGEHGVLKDRDNEYLKARSIPPLRIPPGYSSDQIEAKFPVSTGNYSLADAKVELTPPGFVIPTSKTGH
jgi:uncharacterized lipoprotein